MTINPQNEYPPTLAADILAIQAALAAIQDPAPNPVLAWLRELAGSLAIGPPDGPPAMFVRSSNLRIGIAGNVNPQCALDIGGTGSKAVRICRGKDTQQAAVILGTGNASRWAIQLRGDGSEDLYVRNEPAETNALRIESRPGQCNLTLLGGSKSYGGGVGMILIRNASVLPSTKPTGGGLLYVDNGTLCWRGSHGTVTRIAEA